MTKLDGDSLQFYSLVRQNRAPQASLITGPDSGQNLDLATSFAQALLCQSPEPEGACGSCLMCRLMAEGNQPDFSLLDRSADRQIKVERIRSEIISSIYISPQYGRRKVYVVVADDLNEQGQNALLKSLEEPPDGVYFILTAVDKSRLLATVLSRLAEFKSNSDSGLAKTQDPGVDPDLYTRSRNFFFEFTSLSRADILLEVLDSFLADKDNFASLLADYQNLLRDLAYLLSWSQTGEPELYVAEEAGRSRSLADRISQAGTQGVDLVGQAIEAGQELEEALRVNTSWEVSLGQYLLTLRHKLSQAVKGT